MNPELREFFELERKRVVEPDPYFPQRVMARWREQRQIRELEAGIWDVVPTATRPVLAFALTVLLALVSIEIWGPMEPSRGMVEAYLAGQHSAEESFLYTYPEADIPRDEVLEYLIVLEGGQ